MKIAIFTPYNIFLNGGVQEHVANQAAILRSRGHDVTILTPRPRGQKTKDAPSGTIFLGMSARIKTPSATSGDVSAALDSDAIDVILNQNFDVVHVHEPMVPIVPRQILSAFDGHALRVGTFHAALPGNTIGKTLLNTYKTYARAVVPHVDVITAVTPAAIGYIEDIVDKKINYIPNAIDVEKYYNRNTERDPNSILFIGRLEKRKGARYLIKAYQELKTTKPDIKLTIAGDGPLRKSLEKYVRDNEIEDVEFLGFISEKEKLSLLSTCGVYSSPALYGESFGIVLAEAMAMGAPTVAHPNDGYKWVLRETGRLSLVDCTDKYQYAQRLQLMLEDNILRSAWQKWAEKYVKQFDYEKVVDAYEKLYKENI